MKRFASWFLLMAMLVCGPVTALASDEAGHSATDPVQVALWRTARVVADRRGVFRARAIYLELRPPRVQARC